MVGERTSGSNNEISGSVDRSVQAEVVHGGVHFHAAGGESGVPRQLPAAARHFVNRAVEQDVLTTLLNGGDGAVLLSTIDGTAGVGKSTLAVHWSRQRREDFPDGELYVNLRGFDPVTEPVQPAEALGTFLVALGIPPERVPTGLDARAAQFRSAVHGKRILVLLDNARSTEQVRPLLPASESALVLVTSRERLDELVTLDGAKRVALDVLTDAEGRDLLTRYLGADRVAAEPAAVDELLECCAGLPLALGIVAVRVARHPDLPLDELVEELRDERERLDALEAGGITGVRAVFSWSYHSLPDAAARAFRLLGLPTGPDISLDAAAALTGHDRREARELLGELTRANLLGQSGKLGQSGSRYAFHDLLRAYAAECAATDESQDDREFALRRLLDHYLQTSAAAEQQLIPHADRLEPPRPPATTKGLSFTDEDTALRWWEDERTNLLAATSQAFAGNCPVHAWQIPLSMMYLFHLRGYTENWLASYEIALKAADWLSEREGRAELLLNLVTAYHDIKDFDRAARQAEEALAHCRESGDLAGNCRALYSLGVSLFDAGRAKTAMPDLERALELAHELGKVDIEAGVQAVLARRCAGLQQYDESFAHFDEALRLNRQIDDRFAEGHVLNAMADTYFAMGQLDDAVEGYREAADHRGEVGHRQGRARSLRSLASALHANGDVEAERQALQQALAAFEELRDPEADEVRAALGSSPS